MTPTTQQLKDKKRRLNEVAILKGAAIAAYSFKGMRTWRAFYQHNGQGSGDTLVADLDGAITVKDIKEYYAKKEQEVESEFNETYNNSDILVRQSFAREKAGIQEEVSIVPDRINTRPEADKKVEDELKQEETLPPCARQKVTLFPFQERAAAAMYHGYVTDDKPAMMLLAPVGTGKTYMVGALVCRLHDKGYHNGKTFSPWAYTYVTKASILAQTERVLRDKFSTNPISECRVVNIEQLRAQFGELMINCKTIVQNGEEHLVWEWKPGLHPFFISWDECQLLKNTGSQQSMIAQAFNKLKTPHKQLFFSATPFMRVAEAKCFAVATGLMFKMGGQNHKLTDETWPVFAKMIAAPAEPEEYSPAAVDRLMEYLSPYIVQVKGVHSQFKALNSTLMIDFRTVEERKFYDQAWNRYLAAIAKIKGLEGLDESNSHMMILVQFLKFRMAAELCRADYLADAMYESVQKGQAAVCAVNFKGTIRKIVEILHDKHGVSREMISLIWGGGKTGPTKKQKLKEKFTDAKVLEMLKAIGMDLKDFKLDDVDDYVEQEDRPELQLGTQSLGQRQLEIDRFQSGKSLYCLYTFKSGGVGLSLHHSDELTKVKCKRKKSGWYVEEDIPNVPTRPRIVFLAPTYSAIELVQGLGRAPRLTSMSDTPQVVVFYRGTIEEQVCAIVSMKLRCLRRVVRQRESWEECIIGGVPLSEQEFKLGAVKTVAPEEVEDESDGSEEGMFGEDEEDEN